MQLDKSRKFKDYSSNGENTFTSSDASTKDASCSFHWKFICGILVLIVCVQFAYIFMVSFYDDRQLDKNAQERLSKCDIEIASHTISKRQVGRGWPVCPPGT